MEYKWNDTDEEALLDALSLNPCFNGIQMEQNGDTLINRSNAVLILVLMEYKWNHCSGR